MTPTPATPRGGAASLGKRRAFFPDVGDVTLPLYERSALGVGTILEGPAVIEDEWSTTVVYPGQRVTADHLGNLVIEVDA